MDTLIKLIEALFQTDATLVVPFAIASILGILAYNRWVKPFFTTIKTTTTTIKTTAETLNVHHDRSDELYSEMIQLKGLLEKQLKILEGQVQDMKANKEKISEISVHLTKDNEVINNQLRDVIFELNKLTIHTELGLRGIK